MDFRFAMAYNSDDESDLGRISMQRRDILALGGAAALLAGALASAQDGPAANTEARLIRVYATAASSRTSSIL
jgi:hypothetical protein